MTARRTTCRPRTLTPDQAALAARRAVEVNPANAALRRLVPRTPVGRRGGPVRLAVVVGNRWPATGVELSVQFLDRPSAELRRRILLHMNAWSESAAVRFVETRGTGQVRIARLDRPVDLAGYWSYVGTEILGIEEGEPTLNLEGFTMRTSEAEFRRVVRHEAGHTLGFEHEHMRRDLVRRIDRRKAIAYFDQECGWTAEETIAQVLTPLSEASLSGTEESDPLSIMCYQIPGEITKDGREIPGGTDINPKDSAFAATVYPKPAFPLPEVSSAAPSTERAEYPERVALAGPAGEAFHLVVMDDFEGTTGAERSYEARHPRYARIFASWGGARVTAPMRLRAEGDEEPTHFGKIIRLHERIRNYTNRVRGSLPSDEQLLAFGSELFETLFVGDVRRLYDEARARQRGRRLDFVFTSMIPWIAEKPWEFAYDPGRRCFLATEEVHFVRNVLTAVPADVPPPGEGPLRILVAAAQPVGFGRLSIEQETAVIRRGFEPLVEAGVVQIEVIARATPEALHAKLATGDYAVAHFIGHGAFDERTQEGALVFEDERGGEVRLGERPLREIFCQRGLSLVFLNACQTGTGGRSDFNKGVAQALVAHGLPALVANQYSVLDASATSFAQQLYALLARGLSLGGAAREARIAVNYGLQGEPIDWAVPVVYARDPGLALRSERPLASPAPSRAPRTARTAPGERRRRIAVWDVDGVFPDLRGTLEALDAAQQRFGFELVELSLPLDVWDLGERAEDGTPYLWAEKIAWRLRGRAMTLGVELLLCLTRHWLRDDDWLNLTSWWPGANDSRVLVSSLSGYDALPAEGPQTDRALAHVVAATLAGHLAGIAPHARGPKSCPLFLDDERGTARLVATQRFDRTCAARIARALPGDLPALRALLAARPTKGGRSNG